MDIVVIKFVAAFFSIKGKKKKKEGRILFIYAEGDGGKRGGEGKEATKIYKRGLRNF